MTDELLAGSVGLARSVTPTRPARAAISGSPGRPLPAVARARFERGLGADLSAVRVHDDAVAHRGAEAEGAAAFAAGPHVYFGLGEYQPGTEAGLRLLLHEVVHTLQQTGRVSLEGLRRVTDVEGPGEIQAAPKDQFLDRFAALTPAEVFTTIAEDHGGLGPDAPMGAYGATVADRLERQVDTASRAYEQLVTDVFSDTHGATTPRQQSFLLDLVKAGEEWEAAATLIERAPWPLATKWTSSGFLAWLYQDAGRPIGWAAEVVETTPALRTFRDLVYGAFRIFLVRPDKAAYGVGDKEANLMFAAPEWASGLSLNERATLAAVLLIDIENNRYAVCREADSWSGSTLVGGDEQEQAFARNPVYRGWHRTGELAPRLAAWGEAVRGVGEPLHVRAVTWFEERRRQAHDFWQTALERWNAELGNRLTTGRTDLPEERRAEMRRALAANPIAGEAARQVSAAAVVYLAPEQAELPDASAYAARLVALRTVLDRQSSALWADLSRFRLDEKTLARAELVPWLALRFERLRQQSLVYVAKDDVSGFDDTRHGHRLGMSTELRRLAYELDDVVLEEAAEAVQHNEAGTGSRLVLISDWRHPATSDLGQLSQDFDKGVRFADNIVLDARAIATFYREAFLHRLADSLEDLLDPAVRDAVQNRLVLQESFAAAKGAPAAIRWVVDESDWAPRDGETRSVAEIISSHPKSVATLPPNSKDTVVVYPGQDVEASLEVTPRLQGIFAWQLPAWDQLAAQSAAALASIPEVLALLGPVGADPVAWLLRLDALMGVGQGPTQDQVRLRVWQHLYDRTLVQRRRLGTDKLPPGLLREATNHDRGVVAARVGQLLGAYDARVGTWEEPLEALDLITQFHRYALPATDNLAQTTALVVDIAGALRSAFVREAFFGSVVLEEERYDLVTGYYGFLVIAQRWLTDVDKRALLTRNFLRLGDADLAARTADIAAVREAFERVQRRIQSGRGFESTDGGALRSLNYPFLVTTEHQFGTSGTASFQLVRVFKRFRFHPEYGEAGQAVPGVDKEPRPAEVIDVSSGRLLDSDTELFELRINDRPTIVRARDVDLLDAIWRGVEEKAFQLSMENLQQAMSDIATLAVDLVELVPGAGQAVMVGRIVLSVATFLASADFDDIKAIVSGELLQQIEGLVAGLEAMLEPEQIWMFLLFGNDTLFLRKLADRVGPSKARPVARKPGRLGRLLRLLLSLGTLIAREVERMRDLVQPPLRTAQAFVVTHPVVSTVVHLAALAIALGPQIAEGVQEVADFAQDPARAFADRVEALVSVIEEFELPEEIIPNAALVAAILGLILARFGTKGKLIRAALEVTGAMAEISGMVAEAIPDIANPNRLWKEKVRPLVDDVLTALRTDLIDGIYDALAAIGVSTAGKPDSTTRVTPKLVAGPGHEEDEAAEPALAPGQPPSVALDHLVAAPGGDVIPPGPGSPLPPGPRGAAEAGFGRSFEHVRLHRATLGDGVDALTRGSHVVIRPGLSLDAGRGGHVLRHELGHVVQQTNPSAGVDEHPRPSRGRPGTAVRYDPAAEAAADRAAAGSGPEPAPSGLVGAAAPALAQDVVERVLGKLASYEDLKKYQEEIHGTVSALPSLSDEQTKDMERLQKKLAAALRAPTLPVSGIPHDAKVDALGKVREHAANAGRRIADLRHDQPEAIDRLGRGALREAPRPKRKKGQPQVQERRHEINPALLAGLIEGYLLSRSGLLVNVKFPHDRTLFETWLRGTATLDLEVDGVFLGAVTKSSPLWRPILDGQLRIGATLQGGPVAEGARSSYVIGSESAQADLFQAIVARLRALGPRERSLQRDHYALPVELLEHAVDTLAVGLDVTPSDLPRPAQYLETRLHQGGREFGLRIATHGELGPYTSKNRHSHHTTQFLFAEYFTERAGRPPFGAKEPGLKRGADGAPDVLYRADGKKAIELGKLYGKEGTRGGPMPAILLAHTTHESSALHVAPSKPARPDDLGRTSQGSTVHSWYREKVDEPQPVNQVTGTPDPAMVAGLPDVLKARNRELVDGVQHVYQKMWNRMMPALDSGLVAEEKPYYETIASRLDANLEPEGVNKGKLKSEWLLDVDKLHAVYQLAEENNDAVMARFGVTKP